MLHYKKVLRLPEAATDADETLRWPVIIYHTSCTMTHQEQEASSPSSCICGSHVHDQTILIIPFDGSAQCLKYSMHLDSSSPRT